MNTTLNLNGKWALRWHDGDRGPRDVKALEDPADQRRAIPATVPGAVHLDLIRAGLIKDPNDGLNVLHCRRVEDRFRYYRRTFRAPALRNGQKDFLVFEGLDLAAEVHLNGKQVGTHANSFYPCRLDFPAAIGVDCRDSGSMNKKEEPMKLTDIRMRDPFVLPLSKEGRYLLFGTTDKNIWSGPGIGFDCYESRDLERWSGPIPAFRPPADFWSNTQFWAPECHSWKGRYHLFATFARDERQRGTQILVADRPEGPYQLHSDGPVTPRDWECLDGTLYADPAGKPWMIFCHEWVQAVDGEMCAIPLSDDLRRAVGKPALLFRASAAAWSRPFESQGRANNRITDGPFLHRLVCGKLLMLWSTTSVNGAYAMGYAVSDGDIGGPWRQSAQALYDRDGGHGMLFRDFGGKLWMTFHRPNNSPNERPMWIEVRESGDGLVVVGA